MSDGPLSKRRRLLKLAGMTAQVARGYASSKIKSVFQSQERADAQRRELHQRSGERIARTLGELKGAVMKVGQMASIARDILPKEVAEALGSLQRDAPPMPYEVIARQIESEFGSAPERLFSHFDKTPFAAASIGQVHRARTDDGREVVVKVQYPGVDGAVDSDLGSLKLALRASGLVRVPKAALDSVFQEVRARLVEELDYCNEADNVRAFQALYGQDDRVVIPAVVGERSSQRVLTLTYEPGLHLSELDDADVDQATRNRLGETLFTVMAEGLFAHHLVHADPNPANFAFRADGRVVLYDFGCVKKLDPAFMNAYLDAAAAGLAEDYDSLEAGLLALGARNPEGPPLGRAFYKEWRDIFAEPFAQDRPFDYSQANMHREVMKRVPKFLAKHVSSFQPHAELVFVDRVVVGHYGNMRRLRAVVNVHRILQRFLAAAAAA